MNDHDHLDLELVELLSGDLAADRRRALLAQLRRCEVCRTRYDELAAGLGDALLAAPAVTPPLGFETRVASRLSEAGPAIPTVPRARAAARRQPWWLAVAAAALLVVAAGVLAAVTVARSNDDGAVLALVRTGSDVTVGTVTFSDAAAGPVMVVALFDAPADIAYRCRMLLADGRVVDSPTWPATERGAWVLDVPGSIDEVERVDIVAAGTDTVWSSATP